MSVAVVGGLRWVEHVMGTTVSIVVEPPLVPDEIIEEVVADLHDVDARFSTYKPDSEISRLMRGELSEANASLDVRHVLAACDHLATVTGGAFDARRHRADGRIDPSGYVKGWAIEEAAWLLDAAGARNYWINAGGDIVARGLAATGRPWRVGIRHPDQADRVAAVLEVSDRAVATSGDYERGDHVTDPRTGRAADGPAQRHGRRPSAGVHRRLRDGRLRDGPRGPDLAHSDGRGDDYAAYAITDDGRAVWTEGMDRYLVRED